MRSVDLSPLLRATVGFDRMMQLLDAAASTENGAASYPPYNIEKTSEDSYRITMAVAGFGEDDIDVTLVENRLVITGKKAQAEEDSARYLHRGIATRAFERRFELADHIKVTGAELRHGLLHVDLAREIPEAMKPRRIEIATGRSGGPKVIDNAAA